MITKINRILLIFLVLNATSFNSHCSAESQTAGRETNCQKAWVGCALITATALLALLTSSFPPPLHHRALLATIHNAPLKQMKEPTSSAPQDSLISNAEHENRFSCTQSITGHAQPRTRYCLLPKERSSKRSAFNNKVCRHSWQLNAKKKK